MGIEVLAGSDDHMLIKMEYQPAIARYEELKQLYEQSGAPNSHYIKEAGQAIGALKFKLNQLENGRKARISSHFLHTVIRKINEAENGFLRYYAEEHPDFKTSNIIE